MLTIELYYYPGHRYASTWERDAFEPAVPRVNPWIAVPDPGSLVKEMTVEMAHSVVLKQRKVYVELGYDALEDKMFCQVWLQEEEKFITKYMGVTKAIIEIIGKGDIVYKTWDLDAATYADQRGVFWVDWENPTLDFNENYFVSVLIEYEGAMHYGGMPFDTKDSYMMQDIRTAIDTKHMDT